ncbi:hypothetical protein K491DRAFT_699601 [Lophiostoma macrostomum CBS 122681]|uniref:Uncharacterized protein n=1 Tax=Lophiostoma macrostomum CBS 122681 TaxID=1314788 RepID=A0A6A6SKF8_9PLEO|nr:hypothetical protein K491DRAFT_699601 [Lophiostoma macrostomum CBS 122681]
MRYIRFLKPPRIIQDDQSPTKCSLTCLITITSDLGDSFLTEDASIDAETQYEGGNWSNFKRFNWTNGMRTLPIKLPQTYLYTGNVTLRVGLNEFHSPAKCETDKFEILFDKKSHGIVSAYSAPLDPDRERKEAERLIERRFELSGQRVISVWEETGESIARHVWDAGVALSYHIDQVLANPEYESPIANALNPGPGTEGLRILELGTGCGIVGITLATLLPHASVILTDLPEASDIVTRNLSQAQPAKSTTLRFQTLDWDDEELSALTDPIKPSEPAGPSEHSTPIKGPTFDVLVVADCTYNPDSSPALVRTMQRIAKISPEVTIIVAMKKRHPSEDVFFDLMAESGFRLAEGDGVQIELPCDEGCANEVVHVYVYRHRSYKGYAVAAATAKQGARMRDEGGAQRKKKRRIG